MVLTPKVPVEDEPLGCTLGANNIDVIIPKHCLSSTTISMIPVALTIHIGAVEDWAPTIKVIHIIYYMSFIKILFISMY